MKDGGYVYIMANQKMGTIYIGSTSDLLKRVGQHKTKTFPDCFTAEYDLDKLVYYEFHESLEQMVKRERQMKEWQRNWKLKLIIQKNPEWRDLYDDVLAIYGYGPHEKPE
ncbi:MAG: GIY-YIG nuclease family protein [Alphaproteobacteria bacterium]|nr:GIY-YIG nuclease family protein [Alphaproteobacteria bacterium]